MKTARLVVALGAFLLAFPALTACAQDGTTKVATCNVLKVMEMMQERKAFDADFSKKRQTLDNEARRRQNDIKVLQKERDDLNPESALYDEKNQQLLKLVIESEVYMRTQASDLQRWEKTRWRAMYKNVCEAAKDVATAKGIDLVLAKREAELTNFDTLTPDQVKVALAQNDVVASSPKADITNDVLLAVDKKYVTPTGGQK